MQNQINTVMEERNAAEAAICLLHTELAEARNVANALAHAGPATAAAATAAASAAATAPAPAVTVVLGGVAGGVARGAKVGARIMYIDAFSPMSLLLPLRNVLYT